MASKGAVATGSGIATVLVAGLLAVIGGSGKPGDNRADNKADNRPGVVDNRRGNLPANVPVVPAKALPNSVTELIAELDVALASPVWPPVAPALQRVFEAAPATLAGLTREQARGHQNLLTVASAELTRDHIALTQAGRYDTFMGRVTLSRGADNGLRLKLD